VLPLFSLPFDRRESLEGGDFVIATYLVFGLSADDALRRLGTFAVGQSLGTWVRVPGITHEMMERHQARVVGAQPVSSAGEGTYLARVAFPWANIGPSFGMLFTALMGNDASTSLRVKLVDLELLGAAAGAFRGPRHGIDGLRRLTGVTGRPLVMNMLKPCTGYSPEVGANLFYASACGGIDIVKDDELLGNACFNAVGARVKAYLAVSLRLRQETGRAPLYLPNITDRPDRMRDHARAVRDAGGRGVMVNFACTGLDSLAALTEEFGEELFFFGHSAAAGMTTSGADHGVAVPILVGLLPRMAGADAVLALFAAGTTSAATNGELLQTVQAHRLPLGRMRAAVSVLAGGVTPRNVGLLYRDLGPDTIIASGGGIQGHPQGATAGARAVMQALEAAVSGRPLEDAAAEHPELKKALEYWP